MKLLSIAVPCYNCEKTLAQTLDSFCIDELPLLDIIIVNDGSSDRSFEIAQEYSNKFPASFRVINKPNGGHGSTINTAVGAAAGLYFKVVDGDDTLEADGLKALLECLKTCDADLVATHYKKVSDLDGTEISMRFSGVRYDKAYPFNELSFTSGLYFGIHSITYKTELLRQHNIKLQEHTFYVDVEYGVLPIVYVNNIRFLDVTTYRYRVGSLTQSIDPDNFVKRYEDHYRVVKRLVVFANENEMDLPHRQYIRSVLNKLCFTHYMLGAFYDTDSARGRERAREFDKWLKDHDALLYRALGKSVYITFLRITNFIVLPKGKKFKNTARATFGRIKRLLPGRKKFTY